MEIVCNLNGASAAKNEMHEQHTPVTPNPPPKTHTHKCHPYIHFHTNTKREHQDDYDEYIVYMYM